MAYKRISPTPVVEGGTGAQTLTGVCIGNGTSAITGNAVTQHDVLVGGASNAITSVAPAATSGVPLISQGAAADPVFGTAVVAGGGTGVTSNTAYAVLCGGTTSTGAIQSIAGLGSSGNVLTSNGAAALPTFQAPAASSITITGDSGGGLTGNSFTFTGGSTGLTFAGAGSTETVGGTLIVGNGGTGVATMTTAYAPVCAGTTATGALQVASTGLSTSGLPLLSNGSAALPSFAQLSASNVLGSTSGSAPAAGVIGERLSATGTVASVTTNTATNVASVSLTAGIRDVSGMGVFAGTITGTTFRLGINSTSATMPGSSGINQVAIPTAPTAASDVGLTICPQRVAISGSTTYYLVCYSLFTVGTLSAQGIITATRVG